MEADYIFAHNFQKPDIQVRNVILGRQHFKPLARREHETVAAIRNKHCNCLRSLSLYGVFRHFL